MHGAPFVINITLDICTVHNRTIAHRRYRHKQVFSLSLVSPVNTRKIEKSTKYGEKQEIAQHIYE